MSEDIMFVPGSEPEAEPVPVVIRRAHYHGDTVRVLFMAAAVLVFLTRFVGTPLPFTTGAQMLLILVLVIAAGITNPAQKWIHFINILLAISGTLTFASVSFSRIQAARDLFTGQGIVAVITLVFLAALYFATRTYRGLSVPHIAVEM